MAGAIAEGVDRHLHLLGAEGQEVHHGVEARLLGRTPQDCAVVPIAGDHADGPLCARRGASAIQHRHLVPLGEGEIDAGRADVPGAAEEEQLHGFLDENTLHAAEGSA